MPSTPEKLMYSYAKIKTPPVRIGPRNVYLPPYHYPLVLVKSALCIAHHLYVFVCVWILGGRVYSRNWPPLLRPVGPARQSYALICSSSQRKMCQCILMHRSLAILTQPTNQRTPLFSHQMFLFLIYGCVFRTNIFLGLHPAARSYSQLLLFYIYNQ